MILPELLATNFALCGEDETAALVGNVKTFLDPQEVVETFVEEYVSASDAQRFYTCEELHSAFSAYARGKVRPLSLTEFSIILKKLYGENTRKIVEVRGANGEIVKSKKHGYAGSALLC